MTSLRLTPTLQRAFSTNVLSLWSCSREAKSALQCLQVTICLDLSKEKCSQLFEVFGLSRDVIIQHSAVTSGHVQLS